MTIEQLHELAGSDFKKLKETVEKSFGESKVEDYLKQYNISGHDINDKTKRPDRQVTDDNGQVTGIEELTRISIAYQKKIAQMAAAFLCANPIQYAAMPQEGAEQNLFDATNRIAEKNKLDYRNMELAEIMMSETKVAELWYTEPLAPEDDFWTGVQTGAKFKLRMMILSKSKGSDLFPYFDATGNMIAFGRGYVTMEGEKKVEHFDLYTDTKIYKGVKSDAGFVAVPEDNLIGKIPVIYYHQEKPEWDDAQSMIDRLEKIGSNHGDTNDYNGSPVLFGTGDLQTFPRKGEAGKLVIGNNGADVKYVTWDHAPESFRMEIENLEKWIHSMTDTPDISFHSMKGLGTFSGFAIKMLFTGAHLKAARKAGGGFGESIQRRINYLKAAMIKLDLGLKNGFGLQIKPVFEFFLPKDSEGEVNTLTTAVTGGIMSKKTAIGKLGAVSNVDDEITQIGNEANSATKLNNEFNDAA